jgi:assimilatory nitrate reductase catalytic subunit
MAEREGLKAVAMFEAIARGEIKALWVMATNPVVSLPRAGAVREALKQLDLFVVSENVLSNDTVNAGAHVLLPAAAWGEKDGTVTNSERRISRQRAFLPLPGEAQPDWRIVSDVAQRLGFTEAFAYASPADVFREHAALSAFENDGTRDFDIGALAPISDEEYDALAPVQWPLRNSDRLGDRAAERRFFAEGGFFTPDRKARFVAPEPPALKEATSEAYPLRLNTGRIRDQWHTMTRSGLSPRLAAHLPEPFVEVSTADAEAFGLNDGGFARVATAHGSCILKVMVSENQRPGSLFAPIHWSDQTASCARVGELVSAQTDPYSGQPEAKATPAAIAPVSFSLRGFAQTQAPLTLPEETWWARVTSAAGIEYRLATNRGPMLWHDFAHQSLGHDARLAERLEGQSYHAASFVEGEFSGRICLAPANAVVPALTAIDAEDGTPFTIAAQALVESEPIVCACFGVGVEAVRSAVQSGAVRSIDDIGKTLRAGSNCGSCLPELKRMLIHARVQQ